ncbi:hypothetical protein [Leptothrix discophora]|uniref:HTH iclR-type domain-containing protein n=1 Tax=Leptothrix discophora TaxID=89 RepID=A0ABT9G1S9_LEPDI|nr:hypothetical protein [Leptothrix discophora]MDP4300375.1 hypothetical protein [Leptothrix discophora]
MSTTTATAPPPYMPHPGGVAYATCAFFLANPEEALTIEDVAEKFKASKSSISGSLANAVQAGLLTYTVGPLGVRLYEAGPALSTMLESHPAARQAPPPRVTPQKAKGPRRKLPHLDLSTVVIGSGTPCPPARRGGRLTGSRYDETLAQLDVGQHFLVDGMHKGALAKAVTAYRRRNADRTLVVRRLHDDPAGRCGVWRIA